ncbi:MAG: hypothetical protein AseanaTS_10100 [Candidatus Pelagadaptatus aseana]|uniref:polyhydroxyalkanoic acid system family protein n=1 Tax=Candidatus Pelagadaptatus aseana TaxID=3120508 RepID=UPI0039B25D35
MKKIYVERDHQLSEAECQELVRELADKLVERFGGHSNHLPTETHYHHNSGAKGRLDYDDSQLRVEVNLPFLMRPLAHLIEDEIHRQCDKHFD